MFASYANPDEDGFYHLNDQTKKSFSKAIKKAQASQTQIFNFLPQMSD